MINKIYNFDVKQFQNYEITIKSEINNNIVLNIKEDIHFGDYQFINDNEEYKFDYYNGSLDNITIIIEALLDLDLIINIKDIIIGQFYIAKHLRGGFYNEFKSCFKLEDYYNDYKPVIFYGIFNQIDLDFLNKNKSLKIIIWTGGDINHDINRNVTTKNKILSNINNIKQLDKIKHISISSFISGSLNRLGIPYIQKPIMAINFDNYKPIVKGPCIYIYTSPLYEGYYGAKYYNLLFNKYRDIKFIFACWKIGYTFLKENKNNPKYQTLYNRYFLKYKLNYFEKKELVEKIYPQCFLVLRLTVHDGLAATVQEAGLMGIKSIHNGNSPSCLNYNNIDDICKHIDNEIKTIGTSDVALANKVKNYLSINNDILTTNFYC